jgi:hypothetical protein
VIAARSNVAAEQGAVVIEAADAERADFVSLRGTALRAWHWPQVQPFLAVSGQRQVPGAALEQHSHGDAQWAS